MVSPDSILTTVSKIETVAGVSVVQLSDRTRERIQIDAVNHAVRSAVLAGDELSPGSFNREILHAVVDEFGIDTAKTIVKSYRPSPDRYRLLLQTINARSTARACGARRSAEAQPAPRASPAA